MLFLARQGWLLNFSIFKENTHEKSKRFIYKQDRSKQHCG